MFLSLNHQKLDVYKASKELVAECYRFSNHLPQEEKFGMISQIRRAALSVHLNIAEGSSRRSQAERKRYFEISRGSLIEVDAAFDIAEKLNYFKTYPKDNLSISMTKCFRLLCGLITAIKT
jgi:four helix bundle protein